MQTHSYRKKYVNGSVNLEGHIKKLKNQRDAYSGLYLSILSPTITFVKLNDKKQFNLIRVERDGDIEQEEKHQKAAGDRGRGRLVAATPVC